MVGLVSMVAGGWPPGRRQVAASFWQPANGSPVVGRSCLRSHGLGPIQAASPLRWVHHALRLRPTGGVAPHQIGEDLDLGRGVVQGRDIAVLPPAGPQEVVTVLHGNLFQGFQAVGGEAGADHLHGTNALRTPGLESFIGVGPEPLLGSDAGLEAQAPGVPRQVQCLGNQARRLKALAVVGIAGQEIVLGDAVEGEEQAVRQPVGGPVVAHALGQGLDVARRRRDTG